MWHFETHEKFTWLMYGWLHTVFLLDRENQSILITYVFLFWNFLFFFPHWENEKISGYYKKWHNQWGSRQFQSHPRKQIESRCKTAALQLILLAGITLCHVAIPGVGNVRFSLGAWPELNPVQRAAYSLKKAQLLGVSPGRVIWGPPRELPTPVRTNWSPISSLGQPRKTHITGASYSSLSLLHGCWGAAGWTLQEQVSAPRREPGTF